MARLLEKYRKEIVPALKDKLGRTNTMAVPKLEKICLNMGMGKAIDDAKLIELGVREMGTICGQKPAVTAARVSVSNFRLREGYKIGCRATLRGKRMYEFLDRLINIAIPRIRDFRGVNPNSFDKFGNYSLGIEEHVIFPEINPDKIDSFLGMDVTFVIRNTGGADESREFLRMMGMPFRT
jgi:large subunit ribosomal protein L5